jgi:hypothetical protein
MSSLVIGLAVLALILVKQVRPRPLNNGAALVLVLGVLGLAETGSFLFGQHQFGQFVTGHHQHLAAVVTVVLWLVALGLHLGYDALVTRGSDAGFGDASLMLYFAVSIAAQRAVLTARARQLGRPGARR